MPVGILRPDWLVNATSLGRKVVNGRPCVGWTKQDFIDYWADEETCEPVSWYFHGMQVRTEMAEIWRNMGHFVWYCGTIRHYCCGVGLLSLSFILTY